MTSARSAPRPAAGVVVVRDGQILLVRRANPPDEGLWAVPGGQVEWHETWRDAARREAKEETGLDVRVGEVAWVGEAVSEHHHLAIVDFHCQVEGGTLRAGSDAAAVEWVDLDTAAELPMPPTMKELLRRLG